MTTTRAPTEPPWTAAGGTRPETRALLVVGAGVVAAVASIDLVLGFGALAAWVSLTAYAGVAALCRGGFERLRSAPGFGTANWITLARAGLNCVLLGALAGGDALSAVSAAHAGWLFITAASISLALDGIDGRCARRSGQCTVFGARFDTDVDALLVITLAVAAISLDRVGAWALLAAAPYPFWRVAGLRWHRLTAPLAPSPWRKLAFGVQVGTLLAALVPSLPAGWAPWLVASALAVVLVSFGRDLRTVIGPASIAAQSMVTHRGA